MRLVLVCLCCHTCGVTACHQQSHHVCLQLEVGRAMAQGEFGIVHRGVYNGQLVAVKSLRPGTTTTQGTTTLRLSLEADWHWLSS